MTHKASNGPTRVYTCGETKTTWRNLPPQASFRVPPTPLEEVAASPLSAAQNKNKGFQSIKQNLYEDLTIYFNRKQKHITKSTQIDINILHWEIDIRIEDCVLIVVVNFVWLQDWKSRMSHVDMGLFGWGKKMLECFCNCFFTPQPNEPCEKQRSKSLHEHLGASCWGDEEIVMRDILWALRVRFWMKPVKIEEPIQAAAPRWEVEPLNFGGCACRPMESIILFGLLENCPQERERGSKHFFFLILARNAERD